jgi:hypothetical protein
MLQEQNSSSFNSQKENMMQVQNLAPSNVKDLVKTQAAAKLASEQNADKAKPAEVAESPKPLSFSRTLEAYSDCV